VWLIAWLEASSPEQQRTALQAFISSLGQKDVPRGGARQVVQVLGKAAGARLAPVGPEQGGVPVANAGVGVMCTQYVCCMQGLDAAPPGMASPGQLHNASTSLLLAKIYMHTILLFI
jgi:hypothetical protein